MATRQHPQHPPHPSFPSSRRRSPQEKSCLGVSPRLGPPVPQEQTSPAGKPPGSARLAQPRKSHASRTGAQGQGVWGPCSHLRGKQLHLQTAPHRRHCCSKPRSTPIPAGRGQDAGVPPGATPRCSAAFCLHKPRSPLTATHAPRQPRSGAAAQLHIIIPSLERCFSGEERSSLSLNPEGED